MANNAKQELMDLANRLNKAANDITDEQSVTRITPVFNEVTAKLTDFRQRYNIAATG